MTPRPIKLFSNKFYLFFLLITPTFLLLATFRFVPVGSALYHSFFRWDGFTSGNFVGVRNYRELFADLNFRVAAGNILQFILGRLILNTTFPLLGALLIFHLSTKRMGYTYRVLFMVPMVVPLVVVLLTWKFIYNPYDGILNRVLEIVGLEAWQRVWLGDFNTALYAVIGLGFPWVTGLGISGFALLIYLAALQSISEEIFDALQVDGVSLFTRLFSIEIPLIANQLKLIIVLTTINTLMSYVPVMILTAGGPANSSLVPGLYLYQNAFYYDKFGYACAIGVVMTVFLMGMTYLNNRYIRTPE